VPRKTYDWNGESVLFAKEAVMKIRAMVLFGAVVALAIAISSALLYSFAAQPAGRFSPSLSAMNIAALQAASPASSSTCSGPPTAPAGPTGAAATAPGWNFMGRSFSSTMVVTANGRTMQMKYYVTPGAVRMEMAQNGTQMIMIMRIDCQVMWNIMPQQQMYMEMNIANLTRGLGGAGGQNVVNAMSMPDTKVDREKIGSEQVGQYMCDKYHFTVTTKNGTYSGTMWAARQLNDFPVKLVDDKTGATTEFRDINLGAQDASLFQPPSGYRKMTMPGMPGSN
jgi:hypothetical protein